jgi:ferredoxin
VTGGVRLMDRYHHVRGIGGSTLHFTGESHRLHPAAMKMKTRFGVAADWPLDYAALEPYYVEAEQLIGVAGPPSQGARWRSREFPLPPHPLSYASQTLGKGARSLGLNWQANSRAALSLPFKGRAPCNYCGGCNQGCPRGDKGSADVTLIPAALATGRCTVRPESPVIRLEAGRDDRVAAVLVGRPDGSIERLAGRDVVLACGAVETPRCCSPPTGSATRAARSVRTSWTRSLSSSARCIPSRSTAAAVCRAMPLRGTSMRPTPLRAWSAAAASTMAPASLAGSPRLRCAQSRAGDKPTQSVRKLWGHRLHVGAIGERLPNRDSRVDLDPPARDRFGMPLAQLARRRACRLQLATGRDGLRLRDRPAGNSSQQFDVRRIVLQSSACSAAGGRFCRDHGVDRLVRHLPWPSRGDGGGRGCFTAPGASPMAASA